MGDAKSPEAEGEEEELPDDSYTVECILSSRRKGRAIEYLCRWAGDKGPPVRSSARLLLLWWLKYEKVNNPVPASPP